MNLAADDAEGQARIAAFLQGLQQLGWTDGGNVRVDYRLAAGFVQSLARPGGNTTGFMQFEFGLSGKWLELLKQVAPERDTSGSCLYRKLNSTIMVVKAPDDRLRCDAALDP